MNRNSNIRSDVELLRIVSSFGIVWFHSGVPFGRDVAYAGLVCFVILSAYFSTIKEKRSLLDRATRLLVPCLIWSFIYAAIIIIKGDRLFHNKHHIISIILATPSVHLWYLPFIFMATIFIELLKQSLGKKYIGIAIGVISVVLILSSKEWRSHSYIAPLEQYMHALPALCIGIFWGCYRNINSIVRSIIMVAIFLAIIAVRELKGFGVTYLFGVIPCLMLLNESSLINDNKFIRMISSATYGVYLIHIINLMVLRYIGLRGATLPFFAFIVSLLLVILTQKKLHPQVVKYIL